MRINIFLSSTYYCKLFMFCLIITQCALHTQACIVVIVCIYLCTYYKMAKEVKKKGPQYQENCMQESKVNKKNKEERIDKM